MAKIQVPSGAPTWLADVLKRIEQNFVQTVPVSPIRLPVYVRNPSSGAGLPDPKKFPYTVIWVTNGDPEITGPEGIAYSNGISWFCLSGVEISPPTP